MGNVFIFCWKTTYDIIQITYIYFGGGKIEGIGKLSVFNMLSFVFFIQI